MEYNMRSFSKIYVYSVEFTQWPLGVMVAHLLASQILSGGQYIFQYIKSHAVFVCLSNMMM